MGDNQKTIVLNKSKGKDTFSYLFILFMLFCIVEPDWIMENAHKGGEIGLLDALYKFLKYIPFSISIILALLMGKPSKVFCLTFLYYVVIIISSILNGTLGSGLITGFGRVFSLCVIAEFFIKMGKMESLCKAYAHMLIVLVFINFVTIILYPEGMYIDDRGWGYNYFLGYKNHHIFYFLSIFFFLGILSIKKHNRLGLLYHILILLSIITFIINRSTTGLAVILFFTLLIFLSLKWKFPKWINVNLCFAVSILLSILLIGGVLSGSIEEYTSAASEMAEKEGDTIASRGVIWIEAFDYLFSHPFMGNGAVIFDKITWYSYGHAHNLHLDVLVMGGIVLFAIFAYQIFEISKRMRFINNVKLFNLVLFVFIGFFIEFVTEGRRYNYWWFVILTVVNYLPLYLHGKPQEKIIFKRTSNI